MTRSRQHRVSASQILLAKRLLETFLQEKNRRREEQFARLLSENPDLVFYFISSNRAYTTGQTICLDPSYQNYYLNETAVKKAMERIGMHFDENIIMSTGLFMVSRGLTLHEALHVLKSDWKTPIPVDVAMHPHLVKAYRQFSNILEDSFIENYGMAEFPGMRPYLAFFHLMGRMNYQIPMVGLEEAVKKAADQSKLRGIARDKFYEAFRKVPLIDEVWESEWKSSVEEKSQAEDDSGRESKLKLAQYLCLEKMTYLFVERFASYKIFDSQKLLRTWIAEEIAFELEPAEICGNNKEREVKIASLIETLSEEMGISPVEDTLSRFIAMRPSIERFVRTDHAGVRTVLMNEIFTYLRDLIPEEYETEKDRLERLAELEREGQLIDREGLEDLLESIKAGDVNPENYSIRLIAGEGVSEQAPELDEVLRELSSLGVEVTTEANQRTLFMKPDVEISHLFSKGMHENVPLKIVTMVPDLRARDGYRHAVSKHRRQLNKYTDAFRHLFEVERKSPIDRQLIGSTLDSRRLASMDRKYWKKDLHCMKAEDISLTVLVDLSGSMSSVMNEVIDSLIILYETCNRSDIPLAIFGHESSYDFGISEHSFALEGVTVIYKITGFGIKNDHLCLLDIESGGSNRDGHALIYCRDWISRFRDDERKNLLLTINDGLPAADGYYGEPAERDVRYQVEKIKQMGVEVLSVYLGEMTDEQRKSFGAMYPDYVEVKEMDRLIPTILEGIFQMM